MMKCKQCGKEFTPTRKWQIYCSPECRIAHNNKGMPTKIRHCVVCRKAFYPTANNQITCGPKCSSERRRRVSLRLYYQNKLDLEFDEEKVHIDPEEMNTDAAIALVCAMFKNAMEEEPEWLGGCWDEYGRNDEAAFWMSELGVNPEYLERMGVL